MPDKISELFFFFSTLPKSFLVMRVDEEESCMDIIFAVCQFQIDRPLTLPHSFSSRLLWGSELAETSPTLLL